MKNGHPKDESIQEFALKPDLLAEFERNHISSCEHCQARAADYRLLFAELQQLPAPAFDFDLTALVLKKIATQNAAHEFRVSPSTALSFAGQKSSTPGRKSFWPWLVIILMAASLIGMPIYLFKESFQDIIASVSLMVTYLIIMTVILIAGFLVFDEYRKYNQRLNSLDI